MSDDPSERPDFAVDEAQAAHWLARRDRGLTPAEQDAYLQWMHADPRHAALVGRHGTTLRRMSLLADWQPALGSEPNPDLFARRPGRRWLAPALAAAAALVASVLLWRDQAHFRPAKPDPESFLRVNEQQVLADGSLVELKDGSHLTVAFSPGERRVRLTGG